MCKGGGAIYTIAMADFMIDRWIDIKVIHLKTLKMCLNKKMTTSIEIAFCHDREVSFIYS